MWIRSLEEYVRGDAPEEPPRHTRRDPPRHPQSGDRIPYAHAFRESEDFGRLTRAAMSAGERAGVPYASVLGLLHDCYPGVDQVLLRQEQQGATYRQLAYVSHLAGFTKQQRYQFYRIAESVPLSQRHAGHLVSRLQ